MPTPGAAPRDASDDALVGQSLGNWRVVRAIARGGFGVVYEARHVSIEGHRAAIKLLHKEHAGDADIQRRFISEANAASRIAHPNIVQIFDAGTTPAGDCFIVMEYLDGQPLSKLIAQGAMPAERAAGLLMQVAAALGAAHGLGIVHRGRSGAVLATGDGRGGTVGERTGVAARLSGSSVRPGLCW